MQTQGEGPVLRVEAYTFGTTQSIPALNVPEGLPPNFTARQAEGSVRSRRYPIRFTVDSACTSLRNNQQSGVAYRGGLNN